MKTILTEQEEHALWKIAKDMNALLEKVRKRNPKAQWYVTPSFINLMEHNDGLYHREQDLIAQTPMIHHLDCGDW